MKHWLKQHSVILISLLLAAGYAVITIQLAPDYYFDDFLVYTFVESYIKTGVLPDLNAHFFLGIRPLFLIVLAGLHSLTGDPAISKYFGAFLYLILGVLFYKTAKILGRVYPVSIRPEGLLIFLLFILFHTDIIYGVFWLSNMNELLMVVMYAGSICCFLLWIEKKKRIFLAASILMFLASLLSKQTGVHLPLLAGLFLRFYPLPDHEAESRRISLPLILTGVFFLALSTGLHLITHAYFFTDYIELWKKPFALAGTLLYMINPYFGLKVYEFFLHNHLLAATAGLLLISVFIYLIRKGRIRFSVVIRVAVLIIVLFIPRMAAAGGDRLNTVQLYVFGLAALLLISRKGAYFRGFTTALLVIGIAGSLAYTSQVIGYYRFGNDFMKYASERFIVAEKNQKEPILVLAPPNTFGFPYILHYFRKGTFGEEKVLMPPVYTDHYNEGLDTLSLKKVITAERTGDTVTVSFISEKGMFKYLHLNQTNKDIPFLRGELHLSRRGYRSMTVLLKNKYASMPVIYFNGKEWEYLSGGR